MERVFIIIMIEGELVEVGKRFFYTYDKKWSCRSLKGVFFIIMIKGELIEDEKRFHSNID